MLAHIVAKTHIILHLSVVFAHELLHPISYVVLALLLNCILILLQLAREQVCLLILEQGALLLSLLY